MLGGCGDADMEGGTLKQAMEQQFDGSYVREHDGAARYNEIVINTQFWERSLRAYPAHQHAMPDPSVDPAHCMPSLNPICIIAMPISPKFRLGAQPHARARRPFLCKSRLALAHYWHIIACPLSHSGVLWIRLCACV